MDKLSTKEACLNRIEELNLLFKNKSQELVSCTSLSQEMKIKEQMAVYEVQKKVVKRKLATLELEGEINA